VYAIVESGNGEEGWGTDVQPGGFSCGKRRAVAGWRGEVGCLGWRGRGIRGCVR